MNVHLKIGRDWQVCRDYPEACAMLKTALRYGKLNEIVDAFFEESGKPVAPLKKATGKNGKKKVK